MLQNWFIDCLVAGKYANISARSRSTQVGICSSIFFWQIYGIFTLTNCNYMQSERICLYFYRKTSSFLLGEKSHKTLFFPLGFRCTLLCSEVMLCKTHCLTDCLVSHLYWLYLLRDKLPSSPFIKSISVGRGLVRLDKYLLLLC